MSKALRFQAIPEAGLQRWSRPRHFGFLDRLPTAPIADSELLHLAHYAPIVIIAAADGPRVAILLDPALSRSRVLGADGRWQPSYCPIALRCLPFWPGKSAREIAVAIDLAMEDPDNSLPLRDESGQPVGSFLAVTTLLERLHAGMRRLSTAARMLVAADVLAPLVRRDPATGGTEDTAYLGVDEKRLGRLSRQQAAALSHDRCLAFDLATACLFAQRHLAAGLRVLSSPDAWSQPADPVSIEAALADPLAPALSLRVDRSPLFSFELFETMGARSHADA